MGRTEHAIYWAVTHPKWREDPWSVIVTMSRYERRVLCGRLVRRSRRGIRRWNRWRLLRAEVP